MEKGKRERRTSGHELPIYIPAKKEKEKDSLYS